eukprot:TRINITY_DN946_c0_g1_i4.p1 TRINITY_DN946_c0_g1~~TRINITY_DN946_c0_g1_i4.p1  ORF type:complete len:766 (+),score=279.21 TRINITY_DN946_c0_g1_i4:362-2659(+)
MDSRSSNEEPIIKTIFTIEDNNENDGKELKLSKGMRRRNRRTLTLENPKMDNMEENLRKEIQLRVNKEVEVNKSIHAFKDLVSIIKKCLVLKGKDVIDFVVDDYDRQFDMYMAGNLEKIEPKSKHEIEEKSREEEEKMKKERKKKKSKEYDDKMKDESNEESNQDKESNDDKGDKESIDDNDEDKRDDKDKIKKVDQPSMTEEEETQLKKTIEAMMKKKGKGKNRDINKKKDQQTKIPKKELMQLKELKQEKEENFGSRSFEDLKNLIGENNLNLNIDDLNEQSRSSDRDSKKDFSEENLVDLLGSGQHILANLEDNEKEDEESESEDDKKKEEAEDSDDSLVSSSPAITPTNSYTGEGTKEKPRPSVLKYFSYGKRKENTSHKSIFNIFAPVQTDKQDHPPRKVLKTSETSSPSHSVDDSESVDSESSSLKSLLAKGTTSSHDIPLELKIGSEDLLSKLDSEFVDEQIDPLEEQALLHFEGSHVITQYGVVENTNKPGLKRAKKKELNVRGKPLYEMQDTHFCEFPFKENPLLGLFAIFDGHAGALCAIDAKKYLPEVFYELWEKKNKSEKDNKEKLQDNSDLITDTFVNLDIKLQEHLYQGCTATIAMIWSVGEARYLQVGNVGDSRAFLCRNKSIIALTEDHKLSNPSERQRVLEMGIELAPHADRINGLAVTRALGDIFLKQEKQGLIELPFLSNSIQLRNDDKFLIVASDGLWDVMNDSQAYRIIKGMTDPKEMANILIKTALKSRDCNDNITVCVVNLN